MTQTPKSVGREITKRAESVTRGEAKLAACEDADAEAALIVTR